MSFNHNSKIDHTLQPFSHPYLHSLPLSVLHSIFSHHIITIITSYHIITPPYHYHISSSPYHYISSTSSHHHIITSPPHVPRPSPRLKEVQLSPSQWAAAYRDVITHMRTMYHRCRLVHADLSEYNLLYGGGGDGWTE